MTSDAESTSPGEESDVFRQFLVDTVEEIATSVSFPRFTEIFSSLTSPKEELRDHVKCALTQGMEPVIDGLSQSNVGSKLKKMEELTKECPSESHQAWRPKTGHVDILALEGQALEDRKTKLLEAIAAVDKQNKELSKIITEKRTILKNQKEEIEHINYNAD